MKRKCSALKWMTLLCLAIFLLACSHEITNESSLLESIIDNYSTSSSSIETIDNQYASQSKISSQKQNEAHSESSDKATETSIPIEGSSSLSSFRCDINSQQSSNQKPSVSITVKKNNLIAAKEKVITDQFEIQSILAFVERMFESTFTGPPPTGGEIMTVLVTKDGVTEEYSFLEDEVDGYGLAKNYQHPDVKTVWFFADAEAFRYLSGLLS